MDGTAIAFKALVTLFIKEDTWANFSSSEREECWTKLLNIICKDVETRSDQDSSNIGGMLLKVVTLEGFSFIISFLLFSNETFSEKKEQILS